MYGSSLRFEAQSSEEVNGVFHASVALSSRKEQSVPFK
jgi:hypothetical protein